MKGGQAALDSDTSGLCGPRMHSSIAQSLGTVHAGRTRHHLGEWHVGCTIAATLQGQQATLPSLSSLSCHLEGPAVISCPTTQGGWLSLHQGKVNKAVGLSLPCHATWVGLARKSQSSENPQHWPINPPVAPRSRRSSLLPHLASLVNSTCTTVYI